MGNPLERQGVIAAAGPVLNSVNIALNFWNMFILGTIIEGDSRKDRLKGIKLWICKGGGHSKAMLMIGIDHLGEGRTNSQNLMIRQ